MRRWTLLVAILAMVGILIASKWARAEHHESGGTVKVCHIAAGSNTGKIITLPEHSAAVNAHKSLHGDCEDFTVIDEAAQTCSCQIATEPKPNDGTDDTDTEPTETEDGDDDTGDHGDGDHGDGEHGHGHHDGDGDNEGDDE